MNKKEEITGALIGLSKTCNMHGRGENTTKLILSGLAMASPLGTASPEDMNQLLKDIKEEKRIIAPGCETCMARCGNSDDFDLDLLSIDPPEIRDLKYALLDRLYEKASDDLKKYIEGEMPSEEEDYFYRALCAISYDMDAERYRRLL